MERMHGTCESQDQKGADRAHVRASLGTDQFRHLLAEAAALASDVLEAELVVVLERGIDEALTPVAAVGFDAPTSEALRQGDAMAAFALRDHRPVVSRDLRTESRFVAPPYLLDAGVAGAVCVEIRPQQGTHAVLGAYSSASGAFDAGDATFLLFVARLIARAIDGPAQSSDMAMIGPEARALLDAAVGAILSPVARRATPEYEQAGENDAETDSLSVPSEPCADPADVLRLVARSLDGPGGVPVSVTESACTAAPAMDCAALAGSLDGLARNVAATTGAGQEIRLSASQRAFGSEGSAVGLTAGNYAVFRVECDRVSAAEALAAEPRSIGAGLNLVMARDLVEQGRWLDHVCTGRRRRSRVHRLRSSSRRPSWSARLLHHSRGESRLLNRAAPHSCPCGDRPLVALLPGV